MFSEISQSSPENTCARLSILIKLQAWGLETCNFIKKEPLAQVFSCESCEHLFLQNLSGGCFWEQLIWSVCPVFVLSRTPRILWQKHISEHLFYRTAPSDCFQMSVIFLKKGKTETIFHTTSDLNTLEILQLHQN